MSEDSQALSKLCLGVQHCAKIYMKLFYLLCHALPISSVPLKSKCLTNLFLTTQFAFINSSCTGHHFANEMERVSQKLSQGLALWAESKKSRNRSK